MVHSLLSTVQPCLTALPLPHAPLIAIPKAVEADVFDDFSGLLSNIGVPAYFVAARVRSSDLQPDRITHDREIPSVQSHASMPITSYFNHLILKLSWCSIIP